MDELTQECIGLVRELADLARQLNTTQRGAPGPIGPEITVGIPADQFKRLMLVLATAKDLAAQLSSQSP